MTQTGFDIVVGLGKSGWSCVRFLQQNKRPCVVLDTREQPPFLAALQAEYPDVMFYGGNAWPAELYQRFNPQHGRLILSPGIAQDSQALAPFFALHPTVIPIGDIELFAQTAMPSAKTVAITGSNGKSTVTTLLAQMAAAHGIPYKAGGNLGTPALDLLASETALYILELSSFQLETTHSLQADIAVLLNTSADHLDRYPDFNTYRLVKSKVFSQANWQLFNNADCEWLRSSPYFNAEKAVSLPEIGEVRSSGWCIVQEQGINWFCYNGDKIFCDQQMLLFGAHFDQNVLTCLLIGEQLGFSPALMQEVVCQFTGLEHRCQLIGQYLKQTSWYNDSKATNIAATQASLQSVGQQTAKKTGGKVVLLLGGQSKSTDFDVLCPLLEQYGRAVIVFGEDAALIAEGLGKSITIYRLDQLSSDHLSVLVDTAFSFAREGDSILFAPACASFDLFANFKARGDAFVSAVEDYFA